jgi:ferric-dicitrate binding protein FerR (iron transport regulator)
MTDDLEPMRLRRALEALGAGVEPVSQEELARMARRAAAAPRPRGLLARRPAVPAAVAAIAASAAVAALTVGGLGSGGGGNGAAPADARLVSFPEGSALHLLLTSTPEGDRP